MIAPLGPGLVARRRIRSHVTVPLVPRQLGAKPASAARSISSNVRPRSETAKRLNVNTVVRSTVITGRGTMLRYRRRLPPREQVVTAYRYVPSETIPDSKTRSAPCCTIETDHGREALCVLRSLRRRRYEWTLYVELGRPRPPWRYLRMQNAVWRLRTCNHAVRDREGRVPMWCLVPVRCTRRLWTSPGVSERTTSYQDRVHG
ncbi:hypothetical protein C8Q78DRAFT_503080 [Trametes maxima]|nr:hypothetical protein C8Q78DRAFT_503080 [Trametes maxima]